MSTTNLDDPRQWIAPIARATTRYPFKVWGFGESIAMEGLLAAGGEHAAFARKLIGEWARSSLVLRDDPLAHVAPGVPLLTIFAEEQDQTLINRALELAHLLAGTTEGRAGARIHRPDLKGWEHEVWVDCMHLDGPFLAQLGALSGDPIWTDLAADLLLTHARVLQDDTSGLFSHGFNDATGQPNRIHWGRGQGWALLGLVDTLHALPPDHAQRAEVQQRLVSLISGLAATEIEPGAWSTVVDHPETCREASISAFVALGIARAVRFDFAPNKHQPLVDRAWTTMVAQLTRDGELRNVSDATPVGNSVQHYDGRALGTFPWGQGAALLATIERSL